MKHNNVIPNGHFRKDWQRFVKVNLNQAGKKKSRRLARKAKAAKIAPRPLQLLRPVVHCPTQKYNTKVRLGRGFTIEELKEAGISKKYAKTIGICVDHRRTNLSVESLQANVQRLKEYKAKLIVFPRKSNAKPKAGDSSAAETSTATQFVGTVMPVVKSAPVIEFAKVTSDMQESVVTAMRKSESERKIMGTRARMAREKEAEKK
jgi:large subunit ribosomal protein L13e